MSHASWWYIQCNVGGVNRERGNIPAIEMVVALSLARVIAAQG